MTTRFLEEWYKRVCETQKAHYYSAEYFSRRGYWLGIPVIALSTLVGTSVFAALGETPEPWAQIAVGLASVGAAVLASLQTFLGYSERAEKHRIAGAKYGALGRELETLLSKAEIDEEAVAGLRDRLDNLALESPNNPLLSYRRVRSSLAESGAANLTPAE